MTDFSDKKVGVVLSGNGVFDGSEIHEATLTLLSLDRLKAQIICMAPNVNQTHVMNHLKGEEDTGAARNVLIESARIARGKIKDIKIMTAKNIDALIFPGGFGAAKNLCTFAFDGKNCKVNPDVERLIKEMYAAQKPLGFMCIAPVLAAKVLGNYHVTVTIGNDSGTASAIEAMGGKHVVCPVDDITVDEKNKVVTTPAYMLGPSISHVAQGIDKLVNAVLKMA